MIIIIDFEASGLMPGSYSIEIAWGSTADTINSFLIKPSSTWQSNAQLWSNDSEKVHGLSLKKLQTNGVDLNKVASIFIKNLHENDEIYSGNPSYDQAWLKMLLKEANITDKKIIIHDFDKKLLSFTNHDTVQGAYYQAKEISPPTHRDARDVEYLLMIYELCKKYS